MFSSPPFLSPPPRQNLQTRCLEDGNARDVAAAISRFLKVSFVVNVNVIVRLLCCSFRLEAGMRVCPLCL